MMTSEIGKFASPSPSPSRAGFTLLELVLFILIVVMIVGFLVPAISRSFGGEDLREIAGTLEKMARTARTESIRSGRPSRIIFHEGGLELRTGNEIPRDDLFEEPEQGVPTIPWPKGMEVQIRPWPATEWNEPEGWAWVFQTSGLAQPLQIRFQSGDYWIESDYSPLTAEVSEERFYLP